MFRAMKFYYSLLTHEIQRQTSGRQPHARGNRLNEMSASISFQLNAVIYNGEVLRSNKCCTSAKPVNEAIDALSHIIRINPVLV